MLGSISRVDASAHRLATASRWAAVLMFSALSGCGGGSGGSQIPAPTPPPSSTQPPPAQPPNQPSAAQIQLNQVSQAPVQSAQFSGQIQAQTPAGQTASSGTYQLTLNPAN